MPRPPTAQGVPAPKTIETDCDTCSEETPHRVEKGQVVRGGAAVEGVFTCTQCGSTQQGVIEVPIPIDIPFIVSVKDKAEPQSVQVLKGEQVKVGDEFEVEESLVEVTAVELQDERRVSRANAEDIKTLWGKDISQIEVPFAMNIGQDTLAFTTYMGPEEVIGVGDVFDYEGKEVEVRKIITNAGRRNHGFYNVREIRRVWLQRVRHGPPPESRGPPAGGPPRGSDAGRPPGAGRYSDRPPRSGGPARSGGPSRSGGPPRSGGPSRSGGPPRSGGPSRSGGPPRSGGPSRSGGPPRSGGPSRSGGPPRSGGPARSGGPGRSRPGGGPRSGGTGGGPRKRGGKRPGPRR